ncbi:MAG: Gfo/Idh/MocA family oxidoreductase [Clostridia bacterium]|nr:Gfo/Idh/MocA family oxidoreductase [Clostridia bacterium]
METVRVGIIGIGNMGSKHAQNIFEGKVEGMTLTAVADTNPERLDWAKNTFGETLELFDDGDKLLDCKNIDAVIVAVPHYDHPHFVMAAIEKNLHVVCEKPAGVYTKAVREMNEFAAKHNKVFAMMFNQRTNCVYRKMKKMVSSGEIGEIKRVNWIITDWYRTQYYYDSGDWRATWAGEGGGVLLNQCPHQLDLLQWICGMPVSVRAFCHEGKWHDIEVEDDVTAYLEYENGATGVFITTTGDAPGNNRFEVTGTKATLVCDGKTLKCRRLQEDEREYCKSATEGFKKPPMQEWEEIETDGQNLQHVGVLAAFADNILNGGPLVADGSEGINGLTLSNAMHLSSWTDSKITLPIDEEKFYLELMQRVKGSRKKDVKAVTLNTEGSY